MQGKLGQRHYSGRSSSHFSCGTINLVDVSFSRCMFFAMGTKSINWHTAYGAFPLRRSLEELLDSVCNVLKSICSPSVWPDIRPRLLLHALVTAENTVEKTLCQI